MTRILIAHEKHSTDHYDASTDEAWAESSLLILTNRFRDGYWYYDPRQEKHPFSLKERAREERNAAPELTDEQLHALPPNAKSLIVGARRALVRRREREAEDIKLYDEIKEIVDTQDASMVTVGRGRWERQEPRAWRVLAVRSDHEYEGVELEELRAK